MKRVVNASSYVDRKAKQHLENARNHLKEALIELEAIPSEGQHGEFSSYLYDKVETLVLETSTELEA